MTASAPPVPPAPQVLDAFLRRHGSEQGGGGFLLGAQYSLAEVLTTGFVQRGLVVLPEFRGVDLRGLLREHGLDRCAARPPRPPARITSAAGGCMTGAWREAPQAPHHQSLCTASCRLERWVDAALARPSAQQTKPADDVIASSLRKFAAEFKDE